ncbi:unnamed protein product [Orchesella dallaii]|uniref:Endothelin-converting enzyme 1 n=1 Tax=Orchesella dallaii TaxID=48710 RepID=A0ABP1S0Q8_9HEXA
MTGKSAIFGWVLPFFLLLLADSVFSKRHSRRGTENFENWQRLYLEKIQLLAKEGGLPEEEWRSITKFNKDVCYEKGCLESALDYMTAVNFTVDPCNTQTWLDFACKRRVKGPDNLSHFEKQVKISEIQTEELLDGVVGANELKDDFLFKEAQTYYYQCKNKALNDEEDVTNIFQALQRNFGNWPIFTGEFPGKQFNWVKMVASLNRIDRFGFTPLIFKVELPGRMDGSHIILRIGQTIYGGITYNDFNQFFSRIQKTAKLTEPYRPGQIDDMLYFQAALNKASIKQSDMEKNSVRNLQARTDRFFRSQSMAPNINWLEFFQIVFNGTEVNVTPETEIVLPFWTVMNVLFEVATGDQRNLANSLNFQFASVLLQESTSLLDDLNSFKCTEEPGQRENICLQRTKDIFGYSLGKSYLKMFFNEAVSIPMIEDLMLRVKQGYGKVISSFDWMSNRTKEFLYDKIQDMETHVAQPNWLKKGGITSLKKFYEGLDASNDKNSSYPLNFWKINTWVSGRKLSHLRKMALWKNYEGVTNYDFDWSSYLGTVQASIWFDTNDIRLEAGLLQPPMFSPNAPGFIIFGGLGAVVAHEIGHSFDPAGRTFNKYGMKGEYWDFASKKHYDEWVQKLEAYYSLPIHQISERVAQSINPGQTIRDDVADNLGVQLGFFSYLEYLKLLKANGKHEKVLPGLTKFTPEKLFFMKYANMWCDDKDIQDKYNDLFGTHSPGNVRATMPLLLSNQFADTFGCPKRDFVTANFVKLAMYESGGTPSFENWPKSGANGKHEKVLPGLTKFTPEKLFFMKYANMWCDDKDIQEKYNDLFGTHIPGIVRATMPLLLSNQFADTFGCPRRDL